MKTASLAAALAGAAAGFLVLNWHPARLFLGDAGSVPLGYLLGLVTRLDRLCSGTLVACIGIAVVLLGRCHDDAAGAGQNNSRLVDDHPGCHPDLNGAVAPSSLADRQCH